MSPTASEEPSAESSGAMSPKTLPLRVVDSVRRLRAALRRCDLVLPGALDSSVAASWHAAAELEQASAELELATSRASVTTDIAAWIDRGPRAFLLVSDFIDAADAASESFAEPFWLLPTESTPPVISSLSGEPSFWMSAISYTFDGVLRMTRSAGETEGSAFKRPATSLTSEE